MVAKGRYGVIRDRVEPAADPTCVRHAAKAQEKLWYWHRPRWALFARGKFFRLDQTGIYQAMAAR